MYVGVYTLCTTVYMYMYVHNVHLYIHLYTCIHAPINTVYTCTYHRLVMAKMRQHYWYTNQYVSVLRICSCNNTRKSSL
jgi:hypothetical protein